MTNAGTPLESQVEQWAREERADRLRTARESFFYTRSRLRATIDFREVVSSLVNDKTIATIVDVQGGIESRHDRGQQFRVNRHR